MFNNKLRQMDGALLCNDRGRFIYENDPDMQRLF